MKIAALLQGSRQAVDDAKNKFTINRTVLTTYYDGKKRTTNTVAYVADCGGNACAGKKGKYGCMTTAGQFDIDCQGIINISATELELSQDETGTIRYKRPR